MNNNIARLNFYGPLHGCLATAIEDIKLTTEKHAPAPQAISKVMRVRRYNAECIVQYGRYRATIDATERCNWASIHPVSPQRTPWSSILA